MINFSPTALSFHPNRHSVAIRSGNSSNSSQQVANTPSNPFAVTLAQLTSDPNACQVKAAGSGSQTSGAGQNSVTVPSGLSGLVPPTEHPPVTSTAAATASGSAKHWYADSAADDAYWAKQPAAVQQLREIADQPQRQQLAEQLAAQGYSIDVPVMVWGWDAGITTQLRESAGYTWVPSAMQQPVSEAPGINTAGLTPYDPSKPPAGSILVG